MMPARKCPVCGSDMRGMKPFPAFRSRGVCPDCNAKFTTDAGTRKQQLPIILLALVTLALALASAFTGGVWSLLTVVSGLVLLAYVGWAVSRAKYVRYRD